MVHQLAKSLTLQSVSQSYITGRMPDRIETAEAPRTLVPDLPSSLLEMRRVGLLLINDARKRQSVNDSVKHLFGNKKPAYRYNVTGPCESVEWTLKHKEVISRVVATQVLEVSNRPDSMELRIVDHRVTDEQESSGHPEEISGQWNRFDTLVHLAPDDSWLRVHLKNFDYDKDLRRLVYNPDSLEVVEAFAEFRTGMGQLIDQAGIILEP